MTTEDLLKAADPAELLTFMIDYAEKDDKFSNAVQVRFGVPEFDYEISKIAMMVDDGLFSDYGEYRVRGWGYIDFNGTEVYNEIGARLEQGHIRLAFAESEVLYRKLLEAFEYQDECEISGEAESCLELMAAIAKRAKIAADKDYIFTHCLDLCELEIGKNYGADYEDTLLNIVAPFLTANNRERFEIELAKHESGWRSDKFKPIHLAIIRRLDGKAAADDYIARNLDSPAIRQVAYDAAMRRKDYAKAERLCSTAPDESNWHTVSQWLYKLESVHERTGNCQGQADACRQILLKGDLGYLDKLRALLGGMGLWEAERHTLLEECAALLPFEKYMAILDKEGELDLLMEQLRKHPEEVFSYGKGLSSAFNQEVCALFVSQIAKDVGRANNRKDYASVCARIKMFAESGYPAKANDLITDLKVEQKRRNAFVDELDKLGAF